MCFGSTLIYPTPRISHNAPAPQQAQLTCKAVQVLTPALQIQVPATNEA